MTNTEKEQHEKRENRRVKAFLIVILALLTVLITIVGVSFAYFTAQVNNLKGNQSLIMHTAEVEGLSYQASDTIALKNAYPGDKASLRFTLTNPNEKAIVKYGLKFVSDINEFNATDGSGQLLITVSGTELSKPAVIDFTDGENVKEGIIASNILLDPQESDTFELELHFVELGKSQNNNINKSFAGHIETTQVIAVQNKN